MSLSQTGGKQSSRGLASHCESASKLDGKQLSFWQEWRTRPELALERKERASIRSHQAASQLSLLDNAINAKISNTLGDAWETKSNVLKARARYWKGKGPHSHTKPAWSDQAGSQLSLNLILENAANAKICNTIAVLLVILVKQNKSNSRNSELKLERKEWAWITPSRSHSSLHLTLESATMYC